ncbi:MAG TPA: hypothetical protein VD905_14570, partial [Flavobacteriales bacterium]|nr:hypothetical protein [Flavobacteriales bacterium]
QVEERINGNVVSGEICDVIATTQTGDMVYISKIEAYDTSTGNNVTLPGLRFQIRSTEVEDRRKRNSQLGNH